jgi:hypothetical protein
MHQPAIAALCKMAYASQHSQRRAYDVALCPLQVQPEKSHCQLRAWSCNHSSTASYYSMLQTSGCSSQGKRMQPQLQHPPGAGKPRSVVHHDDGCWHAAACSHMSAMRVHMQHRTSSTFCSQVLTHPGAFAAPGAMQCKHNQSTPHTTHTAGLQGAHHASVRTRVSIHTTAHST